MSGMKGVLKGGWHPKGKNGNEESWRGDFKGIDQVAGWLGKGNGKDDADRKEHVSRPLSSLPDPASWGPPPQRSGVTSASHRNTPDRASSHEQPRDRYTRRQPAEETEEDEPPAPPLPTRRNRTELPNKPPPPPAKRQNSLADNSSSEKSSAPPPRLPPRLPPRSASPSSTQSPPPAYSTDYSPSETYSNGGQARMNQEATSRLSKAGVSVPALGIGGDYNNYTSPTTTSPASQAPVNELQARFSQMSAGDPSSPVSGKRSAPPPPPTRNSSRSTTGTGVDAESLSRKKAPPPPPPKKNSIRTTSVNAEAPGPPPPLPLGTKPR